MSGSSLPKWKLVENVVTAIEKSTNRIDGTKVIPNALVAERISGKRRQVDVYVEVPAPPRVFRIAIEVRDKASPLDLPEVEQLVAKLKKLDVDRGCIVSRAGFTTSAESEALRNGIETRTLAEVAHPFWWAARTMELQHDRLEQVWCQVYFRPAELATVTELLGDDKPELQYTLVNGAVARCPL